MIYLWGAKVRKIHTKKKTIKFPMNCLCCLMVSFSALLFSLLSSPLILVYYDFQCNKHIENFGALSVLVVDDTRMALGPLLYLD